MHLSHKHSLLLESGRRLMDSDFREALEMDRAERTNAGDADPRESMKPPRPPGAGRHSRC